MAAKLKANGFWCVYHKTKVETPHKWAHKDAVIAVGCKVKV
jgi:hypothetical protein